jgi:predicted N-acyltransferase
MSDKKSPLNFSIVNTISETPKEKWDELFGVDIVEGYGYQKTLEESYLKEFSFGYLLVKRNEDIVAILPFFIMNFSFVTLIGGLLQKIANKLKLKRFLTLKVLFLGSPTTEEFYLGIDKNEDLNEIFDKALEEIRNFSINNKIKGISFFNLSRNNKPLIEYLRKKSFIEMESLPTTRIKIKVKSLDDYIKGLSKNTRKDLRRKLKRSEAQVKLTTVERDDIEDVLGQIYKLYLNNFTESDVRFETLTVEFFQNICKNMPNVAKFFLTYDRQKLVAFNLCLMKNRLFIDKFIGFDLEVSHKYHLYFTTFCHNLDWCIKNGYQFYQPGTTDYYPKLRLGAELIPLYIYAKAFNPFLNLLLKSVAKFIQPKNLDPLLKGIEKQRR